ncbi:MAG: toll/interleukin-1 receptor domain-containing protein, partial [Nitrososphaerota archaeon]|nr:toll/interleukin-1 receptor domain-containing protein [Nitrososphaerota archaeon]
MVAPEQRQDHLFISHASEDSPFAEWLTLKLTGEGYRVWCDHIKLLGGESYPRDIDSAIKRSTFRLLAVLSRNSISKENPLKERTLGMNISRERGIDFVIPLNLDGLTATEVDWMSSDLTYIQFHGNWAQGLIKLVKKLNSIDTPRILKNGRNIVVSYLNQNSPLLQKEEKIDSNLLEVLKVPEELMVFEFENMTTVSSRYELSKRWAFFPIGNRRVISFVEPDKDIVHSHGVRFIEKYAVSSAETVEKIPTRNLIKHLIVASLLVACHKKGLLQTEQENPILYFPYNCLPDNRLHYTDYKGKKNWFNTVGERHLRTSKLVPVKYTYHIGVRFDLNSFSPSDYFISVRPTAYVSDVVGKPFKPRLQNARTKHILKSWYNSKILNYHLGIVKFLADG